MRRTNSLKPYIYLLPALAVLTLFFLGGLVMAVMQSLGYFPAIGLNHLTLGYYRAVLGESEFAQSFAYTLYIALVSTLFATVLGVYLANYLAGRKNSRIASVLYRLPIAVPHLVAALMIVFLVSQGGIMARICLKAGLIERSAQFPALLYSRNALGIIMIYVWKETPFVAFMVYSVMKNIHSRLGEVAATLGATPRQAFYRITLPLSMPSIVSASAIIFSYSFGAFEIPFLLGVSYPKTLPVWAYNNYISVELADRPEAMVINVVISAICAVLVAIYYISMKKYLRQWG